MSDSNDDQLPISHDALFELLAYLIMSARTGLAHPHEYNLFRTITAAMMLAEAWRPNCPDEHAPFLDRFLTLARTEASAFQTNPEAFQTFLTEISRELATHTKQIDWGE